MTRKSTVAHALGDFPVRTGTLFRPYDTTVSVRHKVPTLTRKVGEVDTGEWPGPHDAGVGSHHGDKLTAAQPER
ncbi:hypothetical protein [Nocardia cerradoensis]|uniref:hypothetical protein n=1 Tax=Nocardia cerradoensis TaxID=85688 RepID=UPI001427DD81|nr:hypothetical protein [Nocardia cerradoensis]NKY44942.1 hypothetical protein [Nocardia cerradoensis]